MQSKADIKQLERQYNQLEDRQQYYMGDDKTKSYYGSYIKSSIIKPQIQELRSGIRSYETGIKTFESVPSDTKIKYTKDKGFSFDISSPSQLAMSKEVRKDVYKDPSPLKEIKSFSTGLQNVVLQPVKSVASIFGLGKQVDTYAAIGRSSMGINPFDVKIDYGKFVRYYKASGNGNAYYPSFADAVYEPLGLAPKGSFEFATKDPWYAAGSITGEVATSIVASEILKPVMKPISKAVGKGTRTVTAKGIGKGQQIATKFTKVFPDTDFITKRIGNISSTRFYKNVRIFSQGGRVGNRVIGDASAKTVRKSFGSGESVFKEIDMGKRVERVWMPRKQWQTGQKKLLEKLNQKTSININFPRVDNPFSITADIGYKIKSGRLIKQTYTYIGKTTKVSSKSFIDMAFDTDGGLGVLTKKTGISGAKQIGAAESYVTYLKPYNVKYRVFERNIDYSIKATDPDFFLKGILKETVDSADTVMLFETKQIQPKIVTKGMRSTKWNLGTSSTVKNISDTPYMGLWVKPREVARIKWTRYQRGLSGIRSFLKAEDATQTIVRNKTPSVGSGLTEGGGAIRSRLDLIQNLNAPVTPTRSSLFITGRTTGGLGSIVLPNVTGPNVKNKYRVKSSFKPDIRDRRVVSPIVFSVRGISPKFDVYNINANVVRPVQIQKTHQRTTLGIKSMLDVVTIQDVKKAVTPKTSSFYETSRVRSGLGLWLPSRSLGYPRGGGGITGLLGLGYRFRKYTSGKARYVSPFKNFKGVF